MRATVCFLIVLALLASSSVALATTAGGRSSNHLAAAIPWSSKDSVATKPTTQASHAVEPDGLVVIEEKVYSPRQPTSPTWTIKQGETLTQALNDWAKTAGYSVIWSADHTFNIEASASFNGTFIEAVTELFDAYKDADRAVFVDLYPDQKPKPVVVVSNKKADQ